MRSYFIILTSVLLTACGGGGGSSSGSGVGEQARDVTHCINISSKSAPAGPASTRYTNTCDFPVSLAYIAPVQARGPFQLNPNQSHDRFLGSNKTYIACRLPSQATNNGEALSVDLGCT